MDQRQEIEVSDRKAVDALYRISTLSGNEKDPMEALEGILDEVINLFGASSASICLVNANSDKLLIEVERGLSKARKGFELPMGVGITGWVALYGEPFLSSNVLEEEKYFALDDRIHSEMAAPLIEGGRTVGALNVDSFEINAFDGNDLRLLVLMAKEASRVLENMWMIQQLRRKADQLQTLVLVGQDMSGKRELKEVLRTITREALLLLDCKLSAFFLYNKEEDLLNLHSLQDCNGSRSYEESLSISDSILGTSLRGNRQVQTRDLLRTEEHHFVSLIREEKLHSMLVTPVVYEEEPIGVLSLYVDRPHRFNDDEKLDFPKHRFKKFIKDIVSGTIERNEILTDELDKNLGKEFNFNNLDKLFQVILKSATYELLYKPNVSINIIIKEYLNASNFFLDNSQTKYLNALLDNIAKKIRLTNA